jgi:hypothetical protein
MGVSNGIGKERGSSAPGRLQCGPRDRAAQPKTRPNYRPSSSDTPAVTRPCLQRILVAGLTQTPHSWFPTGAGLIPHPPCSMYKPLRGRIRRTHLRRGEGASCGWPKRRDQGRGRAFPFLRIGGHRSPRIGFLRNRQPCRNRQSAAYAALARCCCKLRGRGGVRQCWLRFLAATSQITLSAAKKDPASCDAWSKSSWPRISEMTASALSNLPDRASLCA